MVEIQSYKIIPSDGYITIRLIGVCDVYNMGNVKSEVNAFLDDLFFHMVINCENLASLSEKWIRELINIQLLLKKNIKSFRFIFFNAQIIEVLNLDGYTYMCITNIFPP